MDMGHPFMVNLRISVEEMRKAPKQGILQNKMLSLFPMEDPIQVWNKILEGFQIHWSELRRVAKVSPLIRILYFQNANLTRIP